jgi:hypothetical protein
VLAVGSKDEMLDLPGGCCAEISTNTTLWADTLLAKVAGGH